MPATTAHPSQEQLSAYNLGQLPPDQALAIENHISECEPCCDTIVALSSDDTFVGLLKEARQLPTDQTVDQDGGSAGRASTSSGFPAPLAEHPRYEILGLIGKGGMGDVYKAKHRMMDRTVALKIINRELIRKTEAVDRFHREVKTAAKLSHPNIVTAHDADQAGDFHFMVMEYVDGVDLSQTVKDRGALPVAEACDFIRQAAVGLQHAHECGMVHRDIKPHNLMVTADGTVKILDFGLASLAPKAVTEAETVEALGDLTAAGAIMGTPDFISPEQAEDAHQADIRSDIYSLGATLYFLLAGRPPFAEGSLTQKLKSHAQADPEPLDTVRLDVPADLTAVITRMMAKDPDERFQTPEEVAEALKAFSHSVEPRKGVEPPTQAKPRRWKPIFLSLTAVAALLVAAIVAGAIYYLQTDHGVVRVAVTDPSLEVSIKDHTITTKDRNGKPLTIRPGDQTLIVRKDDADFKFETDRFQIRRGDKIVFKVEMLNDDIVVRKDGQAFGRARPPALPDPGDRSDASSKLELSPDPATDDKGFRLETKKPLQDVQTAIREYYIDKYPLFAASVNQRSKVWSDPERLLRAETRRQIGQLSINSPVSEVIHSFPGKPLVTFTESSLLSQTELLVTNVNLYQTGNDTCRIVVTKQRRRANANQNYARGKPITENEIRKLVMSEDSGDHSQETNGSKATSDGAATADASIDSAVRDDVPAGVSSEGVNVRDSGAQTSDRSRAPVEEKTTGFLIEAAKRGDLEAVKAALEAGVAPNLPSNPLTNLFTTKQLTALHWAVAQRISEGKTIEPSPEIAKRLIEAGADVNAADYLGQTPLEWSAQHASPEVVEMLIKAGANVNAESRYGTVLMAGTRVEIAKLLIEAGADVNAGKHTSALANAAKYGNAELIRLLVEQGAKVNDPKDPPIHWAGKPEAAEALIEAGADVNLRNAKGETALHLNKSTWSPNAETVELLIDAGADVKAQNAIGSTPLHAAVQQGKPEVATLLIAAGADVDARDKQGNTPLSIAQWALSSVRGVNGVENTPYETSVQLLVDAGAKDDGRTELQQAVAAGDLEQVKKLIAAKADVNETGPQRITAAHLASEQGHVAILAALIEAGAKVDAVDAQRMQPLHLAANAETARLLIAKGANVNTGSPSPLYMATMNGKADVVRELLRNDANAKDSDCATMLNWATFAGQIEVVKELFELRDAKTLLAVESTYSPLHVAASGSFGDMGSSAGAQQRLDIAELLVANGADVNAPWGENVNPLSGAAHMIGTTPLMFASQRGEAEMVKFLLDQQADPKATNASGQTALHFAAQYGHRDVVELLLKAKADVNALTREAQTPLDLTDDAAVKILLIQKDGKTAAELLKDSQR